ncbi:MAG: hypothetical protein Q8933_06000 [Bacteroidota bacterium]|nr:hypothetical protein [Bacteroidota bacterium]MDP4194345.1 hypothetical protein [Bacteroidota bacterium]
MTRLLFIIIISITSLFAQNNDPNKIINRVREKFKKVQDYEANAHIKVDVNFLKVPDMNAKIYFKQPDKVKMNAEGFAMLPKQVFNFSPEKMFKSGFNAIFVKNDKFNSIPVSVIKVIPSDDNSDVALYTLWIDTGNNVITKIESTNKKGGSFQAEFYYDKNPAFPLPNHIKFSFDVPKVNMPRGMRNDPDERVKESQNSKNHSSEQGTVNISYSNYVVNKGIPDSFFKDENKKKK